MKILFQGDSITDAGRARESDIILAMGQGYPVLVSAKLGAKNPGKFEFLNRGISGNRVVDVYSRIKIDCWNENPDILSILVGVNDVWHEVNFNNGVDPKRYEHIYDTLLEETIERFPNIKIIMLEPFVLKASATEEAWDSFKTGVEECAKIVRKLTDKYKSYVTFVPLQSKFNELEKICGASYWLRDGVHPSPFGHQIIADAWLEAFEGLNITTSNA